MKNVLLIIALHLCSLCLFSQPQNESDTIGLKNSFYNHSRGDVSISLSGNMLMNDPYESVFAGGFKMRMFVGKRVSFDADFLIGKDYIHFGPGIIGLPLWILGAELGFSSDDNDSFAGFLISIALMALSAEHIAYHIPLKNTTDISPFVSFLRFSEIDVDIPGTDMQDYNNHTCFVAGVEVNKYFKRFVLSPYIEYNIAYDGNFHGFNYGVNFGYYIPRKR